MTPCNILQVLFKTKRICHARKLEGPLTSVSIEKNYIRVTEQRLYALGWVCTIKPSRGRFLWDIP